MTTSGDIHRHTMKRTAENEMKNSYVPKPPTDFNFLLENVLNELITTLKGSILKPPKISKSEQLNTDEDDLSEFGDDRSPDFFEYEVSPTSVSISMELNPIDQMNIEGAQFRKYNSERIVAILKRIWNNLHQLKHQARRGLPGHMFIEQFDSKLLHNIKYRSNVNLSSERFPFGLENKAIFLIIDGLLKIHPVNS